MHVFFDSFFCSEIASQLRKHVQYGGMSQRSVVHSLADSLPAGWLVRGVPVLHSVATVLKVTWVILLRQRLEPREQSMERMSANLYAVLQQNILPSKLESIANKENGLSSLFCKCATKRLIFQHWKASFDGVVDNSLLHLALLASIVCRSLYFTAG